MTTRGEETVAAVAAGGYRTEDGTWVSIAGARPPGTAEGGEETARIK